MIDTTASTRAGPVRAVSTVFANRGVRTAQVVLTGVRTVDLAQLVVLSGFVFTRGGAAMVAAYGIVRTLVPAVGVPAVTALGFRLGPGALLRIVALVAAGGSLAMAAVVATGGPTLAVLAGAAVAGLALNCFRPVISALLPRLVRSPSELVAANAASGLGEGASSLVGPVLGGIAGAVLGVPALLVITGAGMTVVGLVSGRLPARTVAAPTAAAGSPRCADYVAGARELAANPAARLVSLLGTAQTFVRGAMSVIVVAFAVEVLGTGDTGVSLLFGAIGVGGLIGVPLAALVVDRTGVHRSLAAGLIAWGLPLTIGALLPAPVLAFLLFGIIGFGNSTVDIAYYAVLQRSIADRLLARALGVVEAMFQGGVAAGAFAGAVLLGCLGTRPALFVVGLVLPALACLARPRLRSLDRSLARRDDKIARLRTQAGFAHLPIADLDALPSG